MTLSSAIPLAWSPETVSFYHAVFVRGLDISNSCYTVKASESLQLDDMTSDATGRPKYTRRVDAIQRASSHATMRYIYLIMAAN